MSIKLLKLLCFAFPSFICTLFALSIAFHNTIQLFVVKAISSIIVIKLQQLSLWLLLSLMLLLLLSSRGIFIYMPMVSIRTENSWTKFICQSFLMWFAVFVGRIHCQAFFSSLHSNKFTSIVDTHTNTCICMAWVGLAWLDLASFLSSVENYSTMCVSVCESVYACVKFISPYQYYGTWPFSLTNYLMAWQIIAIFFFCHLLWAYIFDVISVARLWDIFHRIELLFPCHARTYIWMNETMATWFVGTTYTL